MNSISKTALCALAALALTGCGFLNPPVTVFRTTVIAPGDSLLVDCDSDEPPARELYKGAGIAVSREEAADKREEQLTSFSMAQTKHIAKCNSRWKELREWKVKQLQIQKDADAKKH